MRTTGKATDLITFSRSSGGTYLDSDGVLKTASADIPRIEYDANGNVLGLLVEESRVNLLPYSNFDAEVPTGWTVGFGTGEYTHTLGTELFGVSTITHEQTTSGRSYLSETVSGLTVGAEYTCSVYCDPDVSYTDGDTTIFALLGIGSTFKKASDINPATKRLFFTFTATSTSHEIRLGVGCLENDTGLVRFALPQLEQGSFPTSAIPTSGSTATRAADVASIATSEFGYRDDEGTLVCEFDAPYNDEERRIYTLSKDGTGSGRVMDVYRSTSTGLLLYDGSDSTGASGDVTSPSKVASAYKSGAYGIVLNGGTVGTSSSSAVNIPDTLYIGRYLSDIRHVCGHIKSLKYIPRRLTNDQLVEITS